MQWAKDSDLCLGSRPLDVRKAFHRLHESLIAAWKYVLSKSGINIRQDGTRFGTAAPRIRGFEYSNPMLLLQKRKRASWTIQVNSTAVIQLSYHSSTKENITLHYIWHIFTCILYTYICRSSTDIIYPSLLVPLNLRRCPGHSSELWPGARLHKLCSVRQLVAFSKKQMPEGFIFILASHLSFPTEGSSRKAPYGSVWSNESMRYRSGGKVWYHVISYDNI